MNAAANPVGYSDSYKLSHIRLEIPGINMIYSNLTPRNTHYMESIYPNFDGKIVLFGLQAALKKIFINQWNEGFFKLPKSQAIADMKRILDPYIGEYDMTHFEELHDLGYLPIEIKALKEGSVIKAGIPYFTIKNTLPKFEWLTNYLETILSSEIWKPMTIATISRQFRLLANKYAMKTTGSIAGVEFQNHDFSMRGQDSAEAAAASGAGWLTSTLGTDNVPSLMWIEQYYNQDVGKNPVAGSVTASEHSLATSAIQFFITKKRKENNEESLIDKPATPEELNQGELDYLNYLLDKIPAGIMSYVADSYDYWGFLSDILPKVKNKIMSRSGKLVVRPDTGNPVDVTCGINFVDMSHEPDLHSAAVFLLYKMNLTSAKSEETIENKFIWNNEYYKFTAKVGFDTYGLPENYAVLNVEKYERTAEEKGTVETLWEIFGGKVNEKGYKVLDEHIGMIYGDGITYQREKEIFERLDAKGFASTNVVFGVGSYTMNQVTRDTLGTAIKATAVKMEDGTLIPIYKDPKTDHKKKSARGLLKIVKENNEFVLIDNVTEDEEQTGELNTVFKDGQLFNEMTFDEVKQNIWN